MPELSDNNNKQIGVLFYDGTCRFCVKWAARTDRMFAGRGLEVLPFETGGDEDEMRLRLDDGREYGGADALRVLLGRIWWGLPVSLLAHVPGVLPMMRSVYRMIERRRHCDSGKCGLKAEPAKKTRFFRKNRWAYILGILIVGGGWLLTSGLPAWGIMWVLAISQFLAFKLIILRRIKNVGLWQRFYFAFLWPGMDGRTFFDRHHGRVGANWKEGAVFALFGLTLLGLVSGELENPVLAGWVGMLGLIAFMHFGVFTLVSGFWQARGYGAHPIMEAPWLASSVAEFWGRRWNRAFSDVTRVVVFRPLSRKWGVSKALVGGFIISGLAHELVITVPAGAGYGLPTIYFLAQALAIVCERHFKLRGHLAKLWVWVVVLGPSCFLFPPVFMERVIAPFLEVINN